METIDIDNKLIEGYLRLFENLSPNNKLELISKLTKSIKMDFSKKESSFSKAFGALDSDLSAEEIIEEIRNSRISTRNIESF